MIEKPYISNLEYERMVKLAQNLEIVGVTPYNNDRLAEELYKYAGEGAVAGYFQQELPFPTPPLNYDSMGTYVDKKHEDTVRWDV